jgi:hypothetical protein
MLHCMGGKLLKGKGAIHATGDLMAQRLVGAQWFTPAWYDAWAAYDARAVGTQSQGALRRPASERTLANKAEHSQPRPGASRAIRS